MRLESARLILRTFETRDVETFARYRSDPEVARFQGWQTPYSQEQAAHFVSQMQSAQPGAPGEWVQLALERKADGVLIGDCAFQCLLDDPRQAEIGFTLAREFQSQGYAAEAVTCLLGYLFDTLKLHRVRANCDPQNHASMRLLARVGMRHEGSFVESYWDGQRWTGEECFAVLAREWSVKAQTIPGDPKA